jgi:hypothetical protein
MNQNDCGGGDNFAVPKDVHVHSKFLLKNVYSVEKDEKIQLLILPVDLSCNDFFCVALTRVSVKCLEVTGPCNTCGNTALSRVAISARKCPMSDPSG